MSAVEAWLRGPVPGVAPELQPVAHALIQAGDDLAGILADLPEDRLWAAAGAAAPLGFHLLHLAGSLDRLLTYARGEALSEAQRADLALERAPWPGLDGDALRERTERALVAALAQVRATDPATLGEVREVGRARLPATVRGLLVHAAEHTTRHVGQAITTLKALQPPR